MKHNRPPPANSAIALPSQLLNPPGTRRARRAYVRSGERWTAVGFMLPAIIYLLVMFCYPLYYNVSMSLRHFTVASFLTGVAPFVAFQNYADIFGSRPFNQALITTGIFTVLSIAGQMTIGMLLALFFWRRFRFNAAMRALLLAPWLLPLVVSASVWQWMYAQDYGIINHVLLQLGIVSYRVPWLVDSTHALTAVIITNIWIGIPFSMAVFHSGLQALPKELLEAAELDGAGPLQRFFRVTLPLLRPLTSIVFILSVTYTVKVFDLIFVLTGGGPADATQTLAILSYKLSFRQMDFGHGAAVGNVLILISLCFAFFYIRSFRRTLMAETN
jgi:multiple sugar transport system permease protein